MEDNLNFFLQMEGDLNFFQIEDNLKKKWKKMKTTSKK